MNITVINLKDLVKYIFGFILIFAIVSSGIKLIKEKEEFKQNHEVKEGILTQIKNSSFLSILKLELPLIWIKDENKETEKISISDSKKILNTQIALMSNIEENDIEENEKIEELEVANLESSISDTENVIMEENENKEIEEDVETEVIDENNIKASYTDTSNSVKINNQTDYNIKEIVASANYNVANKEKMIIYHTHTCESYTSSDNYKYEMTGAYRTTDLNYTVSKVGDELEKCLKEYGKTVIHDKTYHDYPSYNGSYGRSLNTLTSILESNKDAEIAIDLHRDAVGSSNTYAPTVKIGDEVCAQLMFVIGTDGSRT